MGVSYRVKVLPSGKKVKQTMDSSGRITKVVPVRNKVNRTKSGKRLSRRRRRIYK